MITEEKSSNTVEELGRAGYDWILFQVLQEVIKEYYISRERGFFRWEIFVFVLE